MKEKRIQDRPIFKISLLSISLFLVMAPAIATALPLMYNAFKGVSQAGVETLSTFPNIGIVVGLLVSPFLVKFFGEKATIITGLVIALLSGTFPMYATAYMPILISRFLLGFGIGLFNSLAVSLIPEFYSDNEDELATMIGFQNVIGTVGASIAAFLLSYLMTISWHAAFAIYLLIIPALILFVLFVPLKKRTPQAAGQEKAPKQHLNGKVFWIAILMGLIFLFYMPMSYKIPEFVVSYKLGTASQYSVLAGFLNLVSIPIGAFFGFFMKRLHDKIFPLGFGIVAIGFLAVAFSTSFVMLTISSVIMGIGFGLSVPYMYNWLDWAAPAGSVNLATTVVLVLVNIGCFVSPTVLGMMSSDPKKVLIISGIFFVIFTIYALGHYLNVHKKAVNTEKAE